MVNNFIESSIIDLDRDSVAKSLSSMYTIFDSLLKEGEIEQVDSMLHYFSKNTNQCSIPLMLGILTITARAKTSLFFRVSYYNSVRSEIINREGNDHVNSLLVGLE